MKPLALAAALALIAAPLAAHAADDPAAERVESFHRALLHPMKQGKTLGAEGRFKKLTPAVDAAFDIPTMARVAVGPTWSTLSSGDQERLTRAFARNTAANWAHNFDDYNGEKFVVGKVDTRGPDKLVHNQMAPKSGSVVNINYRMREAAGGGWKIVDVYYNGAISSIATARSDFASTLSAGGAPALVKKLDSQSDTLIKGK